MKKCPSCEKTFDDAMRFCQTDGTPLVDDAPVDPYKTMVAKPGEIAAAIPDAFKIAEPEPLKPAIPASPVVEEVLEIPAKSDPKKTMVVSEEELRKELQATDAKEVVDIPPMPEPPIFSSPVIATPPEPIFAQPVQPTAPPFVELPIEQSQPPSRSGNLSGDLPDELPFSKTTPPIPSPFGDQRSLGRDVGSKNEPPPSPFDSPLKPVVPQEVQKPAPPAAIPFGQAVPPVNQLLTEEEIYSSSMPIDPKTGKPAIRSNAVPISNDSPGSIAPAGKTTSSTLAIISMLLGILALLGVIPTLVVIFCGVFPLLFGLIAIILGFVARSKAKKNPLEYGGKGLAMVGIITGLLAFLAPIAYGILIAVLYGAAVFQQVPAGY